MDSSVPETEASRGTGKEENCYNTGINDYYTGSPSSDENRIPGGPGEPTNQSDGFGVVSKEGN
jgi:hypothetical protein